jgi:hypothetical protein
MLLPNSVPCSSSSEEGPPASHGPCRCCRMRQAGGHPDPGRLIRLQQAFVRLGLVLTYASFILFAVRRVQYVLTHITNKVRPICGGSGVELGPFLSL